MFITNASKHYLNIQLIKLFANNCKIDLTFVFNKLEKCLLKSHFW